MTKNETTYAGATEAIKGRRLFFEDLERETGRKDTSKWGSDASRRKRGSIQADFIRLVMTNITILNKYERNA